MKLKLLSVLTLVILIVLAGAPLVDAQSAVRVSNMSIALWPEYDKPGILVIYTGQLASDVKLPVRLTFAIPKSAGGPSSTAGIDAQGNYRYLQYEKVEQGDQLLVSYNCPYASFQFEYYYDPVSGQGSARKIDYTYTAEYAIDSLTLEVQQPAGASAFALQPAATSSQSRDNFTYQYLKVGALPAGQSTALSFSYTKADNKLSAEALGLPTPASVSFEDAAKSTAQPAGLPTSTVILIAVAIVAVAGVVAAYLLSNSRNQRRPAVVAPASSRRKQAKKGQAAAPAASRPATPKAPTPSTNIKEAQAFCHQCGRGLKADDVFCPACGTRRKGA